MRLPHLILLHFVGPVLASVTKQQDAPKPLTHLQIRRSPSPEPFQTEDVKITVAGNVTAQVILHGWEGCEERNPCNTDYTKQQIVKYGFEEMQRMIPNNWDNRADPGAFPDHRYTIDWNSAAAIEFWGSKRKTDMYRALVQENMDTLAGQQSAGWWDWKLHVRCDDPLRECGQVTQAYTVRGGEYINFCYPYFTLQSLESAVDRGAGSNNAVIRDRLYSYMNRATTWAHELMHVSRIGKVDPLIEVGNMRDIKYGRHTGGKTWKQYRDVDAKWLALGEASPEYGASHNPQNYAFFALANYVVAKKDLYPSAGVWDTNMEPPAHPIEGLTSGEVVPDDSADPMTSPRCQGNTME